MSSKIIEEIKKFVEESCKSPSSHYGHEIFFCHFIPMVAHAKNLASMETNVDIEIVELAAWLHDIGSVTMGRRDHHITGAKIASEKLKELNLPKNKIEKIADCIYCHRGSQPIERKTKEAQIIADADTISAFDNLSGLFKAAVFHENLNQIQAKASVKQKLLNSWEKLSPKARNLIRPKYEAAMILLN
jgi:HD superfamily phosphodiesterase